MFEDAFNAASLTLELSREVEADGVTYEILCKGEFGCF